MKQSQGLGFCYAAIVAAVAVVAGCSGGGGSAPATVSPGATPAPGPQSTAFKQYAQAILSFPHAVPTGIRNYVSPNSSTVSIAVVAVNGQPPPSWVPKPTPQPLSFSGANQNCSLVNGLATCAVTVPAPPGNVEYQFATYAVVTPVPSPKSTATIGPPVILDYNQETIQIKQGIANGGTSSPISVTLRGVVKSALVSATQTLVAGTASTQVMTVQAFDASGAQITGTAPFDNGFLLTDGDPHVKNPALAALGTSLFVNATPAPLPGSVSVSILNPTDVVSLGYGGLGSPQITFVASGAGKAGNLDVSKSTTTVTPTLQPILLPGTYIDDPAHGGQPSDPNYNQNTLAVTLGGTPAPITPSEVGYSTPAQYAFCNSTQHFTCFGLSSVPSVGTPCNAAKNSVANFNPGPPGNETGYAYTVAPVSAGLCVMQFVDALGQAHGLNGNRLVNGVIWVKVQ